MQITLYLLNHNYSRYLPEAIGSALNQRFDDFELLLIDDGSTDRSHEILRWYAAHPRVRLFLLQNRGLVASANIALRAARGQWLIRLDADDILLPNALEKLHAAATAQANTFSAFGGYQTIDADGKVLANWRRTNQTTVLPPRVGEQEQWRNGVKASKRIDSHNFHPTPEQSEVRRAPKTNVNPSSATSNKYDAHQIVRCHPSSLINQSTNQLINKKPAIRNPKPGTPCSTHVTDQIPYHGACCLLNVELLRAHGGYDERYTCRDGHYLWHHIAPHHNNVVLPDILFQYRKHGQSLSDNHELMKSTEQRIEKE